LWLCRSCHRYGSIGYDPFLSVNGAICLSPAVKVTSDIKEVIASSDYITLHVPFNDATKGLINTDSLANAKDGVRILNFARGELVNSADIIAALESGKVSFYVTDFPNDEIIGVKGVIAIPHLGASTPESEDNCAKMAAAELIDYLEKGIIRNSVNYPDVICQTPLKPGCVCSIRMPRAFRPLLRRLSAQQSPL
jgi:D-3-phosphoglycerate dehydrogenase